MFLGLDPSTKSTGWAIIKKTGELVNYGVICPDKDLTERDKIAFQQIGMRQIIHDNKVEAIACEDQFFANNVDTLKKLVRVSSIAMLVSINEGVPLTMYFPAQWRKITHDTGKANKALTRKWVNETFNKKFLAKENDITDAIGIAFACYLLNKESILF
jgi:crossover junction endodeoxyribonuclease RuvC